MSKYSNLVNSRLEERIEEYIITHKLGEGDKIPAERELCEILGVSRVALRKAVKKLCGSGKLENIHGKGTYVGKTRAIRNLMEIESSPKDSYKLIGIQKLNAGGTVGVKLGILSRSEVYQVKRIRMSQGCRISIETSYIPASYLKVIDFAMLEEKSMYSFYNSELKGKLTRKDIHINIGKASFEESEWLSIDEGASVAVEKHLIYQDKMPVEYLISVSSIEKIQYSVCLKANDDRS